MRLNTQIRDKLNSFNNALNNDKDKIYDCLNDINIELLKSKIVIKNKINGKEVKVFPTWIEAYCYCKDFKDKSCHHDDQQKYTHKNTTLYFHPKKDWSGVDLILQNLDYDNKNPSKYDNVFVAFLLKFNKFKFEKNDIYYATEYPSSQIIADKLGFSFPQQLKIYKDEKKYKSFTKSEALKNLNNIDIDIERAEDYIKYDYSSFYRVGLKPIIYKGKKKKPYDNREYWCYKLAAFNNTILNNISNLINKEPLFKETNNEIKLDGIEKCKNNEDAKEFIKLINKVYRNSVSNNENFINFLIPLKRNKK